MDSVVLDMAALDVVVLVKKCSFSQKRGVGRVI